MKLEKTLIAAFILMIFNDVLAGNYSASECNKLLNAGNTTAAIDYSKAMLSLNGSDKDALLCQGRAYYAAEDFNKALVAFDLAEKNSNNELDKIVAVFLKANASYALNQKDLALASYIKALKQSQMIANKAMERLALNAIGDISNNDKDYQAALDWYIQGFKLAANDNERGESAEKVAGAYHALNKDDLALEYQIKAYLMHDRVGTPDQYAQSSILLGQYYAILKNYDNAEKTLNKIIKFANEQGGEYYEAKASYVLAKVELARGDTEKAAKLIEKATLIAKRTQDAALEKEIEKEIQGLF
ncbi:NrfG FOG, TPR repeat [Methylophilaceae bacterium]